MYAFFFSISNYEKNVHLQVEIDLNLYIYQLTVMGWLSKFFKGSNHEVTEREYNWRYEDNTPPYGNYPSTSWVNIADIYCH